MIKLIHDDCLNAMKNIEDCSIDCIITDPPYGVTACKWDSIIPLEPMWIELKRVIKDNAAICLFGSQPFTSNLISSNYQMFKYCWIYEKTSASGFFNSKKRPLVSHEDICIFYNNQPTYKPQKTKYHKKSNRCVRKKDVMNKTTVYGKISKDLEFNGSTKRFPRSVIKFSKDVQRTKQSKTNHPTQKPVNLIEYLIKTYTKENELVLDFCAGSFTTGVAAKRLNRNFIGIKKKKKYYDISKKRIDEVDPLFNQ